MKGSLSLSHPEDIFQLPKGADLSVNTCKMIEMISCKSFSAHCLFEGLYLLCPGRKVVPRGAENTKLMLWRQGDQLADIAELHM